MIVDPRPQPDGHVLCQCGREMRPMVGWRISVADGNRAWRLWWECLSAEHVSAAVPIPTEGVGTLGDVRNDGGDGLHTSGLAGSPAHPLPDR